MPHKIQNLVALYLTKEASIAELDELSKWIKNPANKREFVEYIKITYAIEFNMKEFGSENSKKKLLYQIEKDKKRLRRKRLFSFAKYGAVILAMLGLGYFYSTGHFSMGGAEINIPETTPVMSNETIINSGSDKATLTLEDGTVIELEKGKEVQAANLTSNGQQLIYEDSKSSKSNISYNYLTIPRAGQFQLKLADGTQVWLNSESRLKYPVAFVKGATRTVELVYGEAYFDVSPSIEHQGATFKVINQLQEIEVLGTEFNLKAYKEESNIYTTLVEGEVVVSTDTDKIILAPGYQSDLNWKNSEVNTKKVDVSDATLWKDGIFSFHNISFKEIAKVMSRWYDVEIQFVNPKLKTMKFNGVFRKEEPLDDILKSILTTKSIKAYDLKERKVTIE